MQDTSWPKMRHAQMLITPIEFQVNTENRSQDQTLGQDL